MIHHFVLTRVFSDDIIRPSMSHQPVIDGFEFASAGAKQQGCLAAERFPALARYARVGRRRSRLRGRRACATSTGAPALRLQGATARCSCVASAAWKPLPFEVQADDLLVLAATLRPRSTPSPVDADVAGPDRGGQEMPVRELVGGRADPRSAVRAAARELRSGAPAAGERRSIAVRRPARADARQSIE